MTETKKPIDSPYIAWFDLETTGNRKDDSIIEVGFALTDRDLNEVTALSAVVLPHDYNFLRSRMDKVVVEMHEANGLLADLCDMEAHADIPRGPNRIDDHIATILKEYGKGNHVPLAGSGVSHFDRQYIRREMPRTDAKLSYWSLDIGVMRRWLQWWGIETPGSELRQAKTHRALDDVREHIAEAKVIRDVLRLNAERAWLYDDLRD
jgi:oligoribonuclease (3'-5' exoribonuclease)